MCVFTGAADTGISTPTRFPIADLLSEGIVGIVEECNVWEMTNYHQLWVILIIERKLINFIFLMISGFVSFPGYIPQSRQDGLT